MARAALRRGGFIETALSAMDSGGRSCPDRRAVSRSLPHSAVIAAPLLTVLVVAMFGVNRLRSDPRSVMLNLLMTSLGLGALSVVASAFGLLTGHAESVRLYAWPITYPAIAVGAVAVIIAWRHRTGRCCDRPSSDRAGVTA